MKTSKSSKTKKPKLTEEEKRERVREALLKKKSFEDKALQLVEQLLETGLTPDFLIESAHVLNQGFYSDVVEERSLTGLCGYPLCDKQKPSLSNKGKYHISLIDKKVYDLEERKLFCSNHCFKASNFYKNQLETSPLWLRETEKLGNIRLYQGDTKTQSELRGDAVDIGIIENLNNNLVEKSRTIESDSISDEGTIDNYESELCDKLSNPMEDHGETKVTVKFEKTSKKKSQDVVYQLPKDAAFKAMKEWFTIDSYRFIYGEEQLKERLRECNVNEEDKEWVSTFGDQHLDQRYQAKYRELCRKLDLMELLDEKEDAEDKLERLPLPSFEMLLKHSEEENKKMNAFLGGKQSYNQDLVSNVVDKSVEDADTRIPLLDHKAQQQLRRRLVQDNLLRTLPEILKLLKLTMEDIRGDLKELINSFKFTANNVVFKPEEWNLLAIIILKIISERNDRVKTALVGEEQKKYLTLVLMSYEVDLADVDVLIGDLTSDIKMLIACYEI